MSALTYELKKPTSPVTRWLHATFPNHKDIQAEFRTAAGVAQVLPTKAVSTGTQGAAIDWWLRMLVDPSVSLHLAVAGLRTRRIVGTCAGVDLLATLTAGAADPRMRPADFGDRSFLGYTLMDYSDAYRLHTVAVYAVRFGHLAAWPLDTLCTQLAGRPVDLPTLRHDFKHVLRTELPATLVR